MALLEQEHLRVILLDTRDQVMAVKEIYIGVHTAIVRPAEVFRDAVREGFPSIIVVHNHPSGDPTPSTHDAALTRRLLEVGRMLEIELIDHVVIGRDGPASLKNLGIGFERD
jgi:DNA repair protein RadC